MLLAIIALGLLGGLITGISPCILPVLPIIFLSGGADSARNFSAFNTNKPQVQASKWRPYQVVGGLVLSFSAFTLFGTLLLNVLHLPQDIVRIVGIIFLILVGLGMIIPSLEHILEKPFSWIPQKNINSQRGGFLLGLLLGLVYVPCAGPVLAAITVAGATGEIGADTIALTISFAAGTAIPLLFFALAGRSITERIKAFRKRQRLIRSITGTILIVLALALALNLPAQFQRLIPHYTQSTEEFVSRGTSQNLNQKTLGDCKDGQKDLQDCGIAPELTGLTGYFNSPTEPSLAQKKGKVVLVDFWAYSCINCQRTAPHLNEIYTKYKDAGLEIIGVHTPEYAFEHETANVAAGAKDLGIKYPVAQDNNYATWNAYSNHYWPAHYLIDAEGKLRAIKYGEGDYDVLENQIRELLQAANPKQELPQQLENKENEQSLNRSPETYLGIGRSAYFVGQGKYSPGTHSFTAEQNIPVDRYSLAGKWKLDQEKIEPVEKSELLLHYRGRGVQLVVSGTGSITVESKGKTKTYDISGAPNALHIVGEKGKAAEQTEETLKIKASPGVQMYSVTFS